MKKSHRVTSAADYISPCVIPRSLCKNGGLCEDADGFAAELTCRCLAGFTGARCEIDVDDCLMEPCANGATCLDAVNRFSCLCPAGFSGRFCTINLDDCASRPCLNSGRCLDRAGGFHCVCQLGFTGATCETAVRSNDAQEPGGTTLEWEGGGAQYHLSNEGKIQGSLASPNASRHSNRLFKVTVSERPAGSLSEVQFITLLVLAGMTLGVVVLTATVVLQGHCRDCGHTDDRRPAQTSSSQHVQRDGDDCHIIFLNAAEPEKKKVNNDVI